MRSYSRLIFRGLADTLWHHSRAARFGTDCKYWVAPDKSVQIPVLRLQRADLTVRALEGDARSIGLRYIIRSDRYARMPASGISQPPASRTTGPNAPAFARSVIHRTDRDGKKMRRTSRTL